MGAVRHVHVIDDDPDLEHALGLILGPLDWAVRWSPTATAGLAALRAAPPDLILLDVMLSSPTEGYLVALEIRANLALAEIPLVFMSAIPRRVFEEEAQQHGLTDATSLPYLEKPLEADAVRSVIMRVGAHGGVA